MGGFPFLHFFVFSELGLFRLDLGLLTVADGDDVVGDAGAAVDDGLLGGGCHVRRHDDVVVGGTGW